MKMKKSLLGIACATMMLASCGGKSKTSENINNVVKKSMDSVVKVEATVEIKDHDVLVYSYLQQVVINDDNSATSSVTVKQLGETFALTETTNKDTIKSVDRNTLFNYDLKKVNFLSYSDKDNKITGTISKDNFAKVFKTEAKITSDAEFTLDKVDSKISKINCNYSNSDLVVEIAVSYLYE